MLKTVSKPQYLSIVIPIPFIGVIYWPRSSRSIIWCPDKK